MIIENLYEKVLISPCIDEKATKLHIISGYASSAMAFHHLEDIKKNNCSLEVSLLVGMCPSDGIAYSNHKGFKNIVESQYAKQFKCSYIFKNPSVHSKLYIWYKDNVFLKAFIGSANYTQNGFSNLQRECISEIYDAEVTNYYKLLEKDSIFCEHEEAELQIQIFKDSKYLTKLRNRESQKNTITKLNTSDVEQVTISLLSSKTGAVQKTAGLNWGQREKRNPNQAYIQLPPEVYKSDFFPLRTQHFTVVTDDSKTFICTRAQKSEDGQAIETPHNNSLLGEYFRNRLGLANGAFIKKEDLEHYGRTTVTFYKFDNENYYMDFSIGNKN